VVSQTFRFVTPILKRTVCFIAVQFRAIHVRQEKALHDRKPRETAENSTHQIFPLRIG
jgi:hypothetical protein